MKLKMFAIYDSKAAAFITPFFQANEAVALRLFSNGVNLQDHPWNQHPGDYTLFELGQFDIEKGSFELLTAHKNLGNGVTVIQGGTDRTFIDEVERDGITYVAKSEV